MNKYSIAKQITAGTGIQIYLLDIESNSPFINRSIIPRSQLDEISQYKLRIDSDKRLLARTFLYEYLREHHSIDNFELTYNEYKKPFLKTAPGFGFSFSYAKDYLLVAISQHKNVGVDIEFIDPVLTVDEIAPEIMCPAELRQFDRYRNHPLQQSVFFYNLFSAKESIIKSFGTGLNYDVKNLDALANTEFFYLDAKFIYQDLGVWMNQYSLAICFEK